MEYKYKPHMDKSRPKPKVNKDACSDLDKSQYVHPYVMNHILGKKVED